MPAPFVHLRAYTAYSLAESMLKISEIVDACKDHGMPAVAIADNTNLFGSLEFSLACVDNGIQPIMGCALRVERPAAERRGPVPCDVLPLYAKNRTGWQNLMKLASLAWDKPLESGVSGVRYSDIAEYADGLIALTGGARGTLGVLLQQGQDAEAHAFLRRMQGWFGDRLYIEIQRHGLPEEEQIEPRLIRLALDENIPLVASNEAYFLTPDMYEAHDALLCIAEGRYVSEPDRRRVTPEHYLKTPEEMCALFADLPEALANTVVVARRCATMATKDKPMLPSFSMDEVSEFSVQAREGLEWRLKEYVFTESMNEEDRDAKAREYRERLEFEIQTIIAMQFPGYFLIVSDFIKWSKQQGIPVGPGRGSGAGSLVAWALSITDLDPLRYGLLFERFLNPERVSMPDFDVDFCQERRDKVIDYVRDRYGNDRVAAIITFGKLQARAVLRDVGRVLQMPYGQVDKICKLVPANPANPVDLPSAIEMEPMLRAAIEGDESVKKMVDIALQLEGMYRHASTHAAGVVIADRPLVELVPMYRDPRADMPVVQYSMKWAESAGLVKFDFLGLKTLSVLVEAVKLIRQSRGIEIDLLKLPDDPKTYDMLSRADTAGVFQLESAGMRDALRRIRPNTMEDIIALVSLYRPGPMENIPAYGRRKHGEEAVEYPHPSLEPILKETFGIIIYQEQVMEIARVLAGYSLGQADLLRRAMGKKIKSEMDAQRATFVEGAVARDVPKGQAGAIFDLLAKFASYGFNKSHAAAYALIAYQTAYLKANYPVEFVAATMTYDLHLTDKLSAFAEEAKRHDIPVLVPDINASGQLFGVEKHGEDFAIRYALGALKNVGEQAMATVVAAREASGPFKDIFDFAARVDPKAVNRKTLENLIKSGAFDSLHGNRAQLFMAVDIILGHASVAARERESMQANLFGGPASNDRTPAPPLPPVNEWPLLERLNAEAEAVGFFLSTHPLSAYAEGLARQGVISARELPMRLGTKYAPVKVAGIVVGKKMKASQKGRFAFVQLSDASAVYEVSIFNEDLLASSWETLEEGKLLLIHADGKCEEEQVRLIATRILSLDTQQMASELTLCVDVENAKALVSLKEWLALRGKGKTRIRLAVDAGEGRRVQLQLPQGYDVAESEAPILATVPGIGDVKVA